MNWSGLNPLTWNWPFGWFSTAAIKTNLSDNTPQEQDTTQRQDLYAQQYGFGYGMPSVIGYSEAPLGSTQIYRRMMRTWPVLPLAYCCKRAQTISAPYTIESDKDSNPKAKALIEKIYLDKATLLPLLATLFRAVVMRYSPVLPIYGINEDGMMVPRKFKSLVPDNTQILIDEHGETIGVRQNGLDFTGPNYLLYVNESDDTPVTGYSLLENVRESWWQWMEGRQRAGQLNKKAAGTVFSALGPETQGAKIYTLPDGTKVTGSDAAAYFARMLSQGISIGGSNVLHKITGQATTQQLAQASELGQFHFEYYDLGNVGPMLDSLDKDLAYLDANGFRGMYLPERAGLEGQHGTKAESGEHKDFVDAQTDLDRQSLAAAIQPSIDWTLRLNFGPKEVGKHRLSPSPVIDENLQFLRKIIEGMIQQGLAGKVARFCQMGGLFNKTGLQINEKMDSKIDDPEEWDVETVTPSNTPVKQGKNGNNGNGDDTLDLSRVNRWLNGF